MAAVQIRDGNNTLIYIEMDGAGTAGNPYRPVQRVNSVKSKSIDAVSTAATGINWSALPAGACSELTMVNVSGVVVEYRYAGTSASLPIPHNNTVTIEGIANSNEVEVRRQDSSNTQVTIGFERRTR